MSDKKPIKVAIVGGAHRAEIAALITKLGMSEVVALSIEDVRPADKFDRAFAEASPFYAPTGKRKAQWKTERNKR